MDMAFKLNLKVMDNKTQPSNLHMVVTNVNSEELVSKNDYTSNEHVNDN
jgi:hypothetical protein